MYVRRYKQIKTKYGVLKNTNYKYEYFAAINYTRISIDKVALSILI